VCVSLLKYSRGGLHLEVEFFPFWVGRLPVLKFSRRTVSLSDPESGMLGITGATGEMGGLIFPLSPLVIPFFSPSSCQARTPPVPQGPPIRVFLEVLLDRG